METHRKIAKSIERKSSRNITWTGNNLFKTPKKKIKLKLKNDCDINQSDIKEKRDKLYSSNKHANLSNYNNNSQKELFSHKFNKENSDVNYVNRNRNPKNFRYSSRGLNASNHMTLNNSKVNIIRNYSRLNKGNDEQKLYKFFSILNCSSVKKKKDNIHLPSINKFKRDDSSQNPENSKENKRYINSSFYNLEENNIQNFISNELKKIKKKDKDKDKDIQGNKPEISKEKSKEIMLNGNNISNYSKNSNIVKEVNHSH